MNNPTKKKSKVVCCVVACKNNYTNSPNCKFYVFPSVPHKKPQREKWILAVNRKSAYGSLWQPNKYSKICSAHFIGNNKSDHPLSPSFIPSIFPSGYKRKTENVQNKVDRFQRTLKRQKTTINVNTTCNAKDSIILHDSVPDVDGMEEIVHNNITNLPKTLLKSDQAVQVDFLDDSNDSMLFASAQYIHGDFSDASVQTYIPMTNQRTKFIAPQTKITKDKCCGPCFTHKDVAVGPDSREDKMPIKCTSGFHGFSSIKDDESLLDIGGVTRQTFAILLKVLQTNKSESNKKILNHRKIHLEDRLFIFVIKMKTGLSFSAISLLFQLHRSTISRIFFSTLTYLSNACKSFVVWPSRDEVQSMMPDVFKEDYKDCRVIIDCTEIPVEQPTLLEDRIRLYSGYKKTFTVKILIGCTPNGLISFVSKSYGGRASDPQITTGSGFLDLLEPGDLVLADKGFPQIKAELDRNGKGILMVMPPFLENHEFTEEQVSETYQVARVRIHIERIMQRIKIYNILHKLSMRMLPYCDDLIFMSCVLVNLQPPIIKNSDNRSDDN